MQTSERIDPGLCGTCQYARRTETRRGSVFYRCALASTVAWLQKYPPLPVLHCEAYQPREAGEAGREDTQRP